MRRQSGSNATCPCAASRALLIPLALFGGAPTLVAQSQYVTPDGKGDITFTPGMRIQTRYEFDAQNSDHDVFVRRFRLKGSGTLFGIANYYAEVKIDNVARFGRLPPAQVENAWLNFPVNPDLSVRIGLYDMVFSRNALTSDSKLLLMDRSLIKGALTVLGLADNTVGVLAYGRPFGGVFEYSAGIFDNIVFDAIEDTLGRQSDGLMPVGRVVVHLLDPAPQGGYADYRGSYIGKGQRLSIGASGAVLPKAREDGEEFDLFGFGADLFFNTGPVTLEAEYDRFKEDTAGGSGTIDGDGWYVQGGYLVHGPFELAARYQELDADKDASDDKLQWTSIGVNIYIRDHNLKVQSDYTFKSEQGNEMDNDVFRIQLQFDF